LRTPAPIAYNIPPSLTLSPKASSSASTFGAPRDAYKKIYFEHKPNVDVAVPGPGSYRTLVSVGKEGNRWSIGARTGILLKQLL